VLSEEGAPGLNEEQIFGTALACIYATKHEDLIKAALDDASNKLDDAHINAAKAAATIMGMNNIYYRFVHLSEDKEFLTMPANLRMNVINQSAIEKADFELYCLAVSAINGCGMCITAHTRELLAAGFTKQAIQSAIRIAAVINATAQALVIN